MKAPTQQIPNTPPDHPGAQEARALNVAYVALVASFAYTLLNAYLALRYGGWQYTTLLILSAVVTSTALLSTTLQRGKTFGIWLFTIAGQFALAATGILVAGFGLVSMVGILALTLIITSLALRNHYSRWAIYLSLILGILAGITDWIGPWFRISAPPEMRVLLPVLILLTGLIYIVYLIRSFRLLSLRTQLITVFIAVSSLSIAAAAFLTNLNTQRSLINDANIRLYNSGSQTARRIDDFLRSHLASVQAQSQLPDIVDYMRLGPAARTGSWQQVRATRTLSVLGLEEEAYVASYALLDVQGINVADSSVAMIGQDESGQNYFQKVISDGKPYLSPVQYSGPTGESVFYIASPVISDSGDVTGVLRVRYLRSVLDDLIKSGSGLLGAGSYAFLLDENGIRIAHGKQSDLIFKSITPLAEEQLAQLKAENRLPDLPSDQISTNLPEVKEALNRSYNRPFFTSEMESASVEQGVIAELRTQPWKVIYSVDRSAFLAPVELQTRNTTLLALLIAGLAALAGLFMAQTLAAPISRLTETARQIAAGNFNAKATVEAGNEFGTLATTFNTMTGQLLSNLEGLEEHIAQRTQQHAETASELRAAAEVGSAVATVRQLDELLPKITQLISERFGFYHVGIFLLDPSGENAVLRAANSEGGQRMLARHHQLKVGEVGIVGYVTGHKESRIAMDVGQDAVYFDNPDLAETRSEIALPLVVGGRILGALDVQSTEPGAFTQEDIATLQLLSDQVAVAIDNARLFSENQAALEAMQRAYGELSREAWAKLLHDQPEFNVLANRFDHLYTPSESWTSEMLQAAQTGELVRADEQTVAIPIQERGNILGILRLRKPDDHPWSKEELSLVETLTEQLFLALENARLYSESRRRAERERLASNIVTKMRTSNDPQVILQTAVQELRQALLPHPERPLPPPPDPAKSEPANGKSRIG